MIGRVLNVEGAGNEELRGAVGQAQGIPSKPSAGVEPFVGGGLDRGPAGFELSFKGSDGRGVMNTRREGLRARAGQQGPRREAGLRRPAEGRVWRVSPEP